MRDLPLRVSALRTLGAFANLVAIESFMDELAEAVGQSPVEFRLNHLEDGTISSLGSNKQPFTVS